MESCIAGHSERATKKSIKAFIDHTKRGKIFAKNAKKDTTVVKIGDDLERASRIRFVIADSKSVGMPADDIVMDKATLEMLAELCKTLVSPTRIELLCVLQNKEKTVTELVAALRASNANISQHLVVMRHRGVLTARRDGTNIYYRVTNTKIIDACMLMREVLVSQHVK